MPHTETALIFQWCGFLHTQWHFQSALSIGHNDMGQQKGNAVTAPL